MSKILRLEISNFQRVNAVELKPSDTGLVVIGGRNGQGKTSILDAIQVALGGDRARPKKPIRDGADKAQIVLELDDLIVERRFTSKTSILRVKNMEGATFASPQAMLDKLVGSLSFDPIAFSRMKPRDQAASLREVTGLDLTELDAKYKEAFEARTELNRKVKDLRGAVQQTTLHEGVPDEAQSAAEILEDLKAKRAENEKVSRAIAEAVEKEDRLVEIKRQGQTCADRIADYEKEIEEIQARIKEETEVRQKLSEQYKALQAEIKRDNAAIEALPRHDLAAIEERLATVQDINAKIEANKRHNELIGRLERAEEGAAELTETLKDIDARKQKAITEAKLPIEGLAFDEEGVTFNGIPLEQCSGAEKLRISVAMGLALNPKLRVMLVRDGSLLDKDNMKIVAEMAAEAGAQVWLEKVGGEDVTVEIEDGCVMEANPETQAAE